MSSTSPDLHQRPSLVDLLGLLRSCAVEHGYTRDNASRLCRYAAEYLGAMSDALDRARETIVHDKVLSREDMRNPAIELIDRATAPEPLPGGGG